MAISIFAQEALGSLAIFQQIFAKRASFLVLAWERPRFPLLTGEVTIFYLTRWSFLFYGVEPHKKPLLTLSKCLQILVGGAQHYMSYFAIGIDADWISILFLTGQSNLTWTFVNNKIEGIVVGPIMEDWEAKISS